MAVILRPSSDVRGNRVTPETIVPKPSDRSTGLRSVPVSEPYLNPFAWGHEGGAVERLMGIDSDEVWAIIAKQTWIVLDDVGGQSRGAAALLPALAQRDPWHDLHGQR